ncbi:MAG: phage/plasmid primase, P4 family [Halobacteriota archaeon]
MSATTRYRKPALCVQGKPSNQEFVKAALDYAGRGYAVIPLIPGSKVPLTPNGYKDATTDKEQIVRWWDQHAEANIGIATGERSNLLVLDVDVKNSVNGRKALQDLTKQLGLLPSRIRIVNTPSEGRHIYFRFPSELRDIPLKNTLANGVEIKGDGRYVVAPPSITTEGFYEVAVDEAPAELPRSWIEACMQPIDWEKYQIKRGDLTICRQYGIRMADVVEIPLHARKTQGGYLIKHPMHGATGDGNLYVNTTNDLWCCFRHRTGGDPLTWVAVREGFVECENARKLDSITFKRCVEVLKREGLIKDDRPRAEVSVTNRNGKTETFEVTLHALDDIGNVERFVSRRSGNLRYVLETNRWVHFNGKFWEEVSNEYVRQLARDIPSIIRHEAALIDKLDGLSPTEKESKAKSFMSFAHQSSFKNRLDAVIEMAKSDLQISAYDFNKDPYLFNVANGTFDYRTSELITPQRREDYLTQYCAVEYDPTIKPTKWLKFLSRVQPSKEMRDFMQRAAGYSTTGVVTEEALFFCHGRDATGKSTLLDSIIGVMSQSYAVTSKFQTFLAHKEQGGAPREDVARLKDARMVVCSEVNRNTKWNSALIKTLVSGERYTARLPYSTRSVEFSPVFKLWMGANDKPRCDYDDSAIFRRFYVIPFDVHIPPHERDRNLRNFFNTDPEAQKEVLAWVIKGGLEWYARSEGGHKDGLQAPQEVKIATEEYEMAMNPVFEFVKNQCLVGCDTNGEPYEDTTSDLWDEFSNQIGKGYDTRKVRSAVSLGKHLTNLGFDAFQDTDIDRTRKRRGLRHINEWDTLDDEPFTCPHPRTDEQVNSTLEEKSHARQKKYKFCSICAYIRSSVRNGEEESEAKSEQPVEHPNKSIIIV